MKQHYESTTVAINLVVRILLRSNLSYYTYTPRDMYGVVVRLVVRPVGCAMGRNPRVY